MNKQESTEKVNQRRLNTAELDVAPLTGQVITRSDYEYEEARTMWNRAIEAYPLAIVYCETVEDVRNSVIWAGREGIPLRIRSGGHHYEGYSTGNDVLVIDVSRMNRIQVDEEAGIVTIEGGVRNRELYEGLGQRGYPFPGGGCPTVGVVGFALGGGWGYSGRYLGLGCDAIMEVQLIDAEGELITANEKENPELLWALKGSGGGQFGVVVSMSLKLPEKKSHATLIRLEYSRVSREEQIQIWQYWQEQIRDFPSALNFKLGFYNSVHKGIGILLLGIYYGPSEEAHELLAPFIKMGRRIQVLIEPMSVLEVNRYIQDAHPDYEHYKSSGRFVSQSLATEQMHELLDGINKRAEGAVYTALSCYGMGGKMREVSADTASFAYRDSDYILGFQSVWEDNHYSRANHQWFDERFERIKTCTQGSFVNFPNGGLEDYAPDYFGVNKERLQKIREKIDPRGVFKFEQSL